MDGQNIEDFKKEVLKIPKIRFWYYFYIMKCWFWKHIIKVQV